MNRALPPSDLFLLRASPAQGRHVSILLLATPLARCGAAQSASRMHLRVEAPPLASLRAAVRRRPFLLRASPALGRHVSILPLAPSPALAPLILSVSVPASRVSAFRPPLGESFAIIRLTS